MKVLLLISFTVPPTPGPNPGRAWQIARHLSSHGWDTAILTPRHPGRSVVAEKTREHRLYPIPLRRAVHPSGFSYWLQETGYRDILFTSRPAAARDDALHSLPGLYGRHVPAPEEQALEPPPDLPLGLGRIGAWFRCNPDARAGWIRSGLGAARAVCDALRPDAVYSVSPPVTAHRIAMRVAENLGIPWIADLREPWKGIAPALLDGARRDRILRTATRIAIPDPSMISTRGRMRDPLVLPPSFDEADLPARDAERRREPSVLVHAGRTAIHGRDPLLLLDAVHVSIERGLISREALRVRFLGPEDARLSPAVGARSLADIVTIEPRVPWEVSLDTQAGSTLLLAALGPGDRMRFPDRILEAMSTHRRILAFGPPGSCSASGLLDSAGLGGFHTDCESLARAIGDGIRMQEAQPAADAAVLADYHARELAAKLLEAIGGGG